MTKVNAIRNTRLTVYYYYIKNMALLEKKGANGTDSHCHCLWRESDEEDDILDDTDGEDHSSLNNEEESQTEGKPHQRQRMREDNATDKFSQDADVEVG